MCIVWPFADSEPHELSIELRAGGFPPATHPAEASLFCRQSAMPDHNQTAIEDAHVAVVGAGGLGSWIALGLARMGVRQLIVIDPDRFDRTNSPRQLMFGSDIGVPKAHALARNLLPHMTNAGRVRAIASPFTSNLLADTDNVSVLVVGIDNNRGRLEAAQWGRANQIPVVFCMLSSDGLRSQCFLQRPNGPCLSCVLPNLEADGLAPCAAASIASCMMAAGHSLELCVEALSGPGGIPIWRETSLDGSTERTGMPTTKPTCANCQERT